MIIEELLSCCMF